MPETAPLWTSHESYQWYLDVAKNPTSRRDLPMASENSPGYDVEMGELVCRLPSLKGQEGICAKKYEDHSELRKHIINFHKQVPNPRNGDTKGLSILRSNLVQEFFEKLHRQWTINSEHRRQSEGILFATNPLPPEKLWFPNGIEVDMSQAVPRSKDLKVKETETTQDTPAGDQSWLQGAFQSGTAIPVQELPHSSSSIQSATNTDPVYPSQRLPQRHRDFTFAPILTATAFNDEEACMPAFTNDPCIPALAPPPPPPPPSPSPSPSPPPQIAPGFNPEARMPAFAQPYSPRHQIYPMPSIPTLPRRDPNDPKPSRNPTFLVTVQDSQIDDGDYEDWAEFERRTEAPF